MLRNRLRSPWRRSRALVTLSLLALTAAAGAASSAFPAKQSRALRTGIRLAYVEAGDPRGTPVLLLHGYTDTSRSFAPLLDRLAALRPDLRLIAPDQRGHGDSSLPGDAACPGAPERCFAVSDFAADALALLDALGIGRAHLVGHSMGSVIAQEIALAHPERVERLVLLGSAATIRDNPVARDYLLGEVIGGTWGRALAARGLRWPEAAYRLTPREVGPEALSWLAQSWVTEPLADPAYLAEIAEETARVPLGTWLGALRALLATDFAPRLERLTRPTLVLWAAQDVVFPENPDQAALRGALRRAAAASRVPMFWKRYGRRPLPADGVPAGELAHNFHWAASGEVARDLAAFLRPGGAPAAALFYGDRTAPRRIAEREDASAVVRLHPEG